MFELHLLQGTGGAPGKGGNGTARLGHRATLLTKHFPQSAVSAAGRQAAQAFLSSGGENASFLMDTLPAHLFVPYVPPLLAKTGWSRPFWGRVKLATAVLEAMLGCIHQCKMCYINAPLPQNGGYMPWIHILELLAEVSDERRRIVREEMVEVFVNEILRGRLKAPISVLDAVFALVRHARNRFASYSDHLICYWKSNPTNWSDPLFGRDYADICNAVVQAFQMFDIAELAVLIDADPLSQQRFKREFGDDLARFYFEMSVHAVTSSVPVPEHSLGDRAVRRILESSPRGSDLVRFSVPHPNLIRTGEKNPERYWASVHHCLQMARPKLVYLFASTVDELLELVEHVSKVFDNEGPPWWTESRLALYEIREGRKRGQTDEEIVARLRRMLKKLCFTGRLEGMGKQFAGSPLFSAGSVMCVNGVVLAPNGELHYQACTTPSGDDLLEGRIVENIDRLGEDEVGDLIDGHPLTNRARELVTPGLSGIPLHERRKPSDWFITTSLANRLNPKYHEALALAAAAAQRIGGTIRF